MAIDIFVNKSEKFRTFDALRMAVPVAVAEAWFGAKMAENCMVFISC